MSGTTGPTAAQADAVIAALQAIATNTAASAATLATIQAEMQMLASRAGMLSSAVSGAPTAEPWAVHGKAKGRNA